MSCQLLLHTIFSLGRSCLDTWCATALPTDQWGMASSTVSCCVAARSLGMVAKSSPVGVSQDPLVFQHLSVLSQGIRLIRWSGYAHNEYGLMTWKLMSDVVSQCVYMFIIWPMRYQCKLNHNDGNLLFHLTRPSFLKLIFKCFYHDLLYCAHHIRIYCHEHVVCTINRILFKTQCVVSFQILSHEATK